MPQATDLVVNNGATTPVAKTFTLITPSAGLGSIAQWALREGPISSVFPQLTTSANQTKGSGVRSLNVKFKLPSSYTDAVTGLTNVGSHAECNFSVRIPPDFPEALKADLVAYTLNLLNTALLKSMIKDAAPAT